MFFLYKTTFKHDFVFFFIDISSKSKQINNLICFLRFYLETKTGIKQKTTNERLFLLNPISKQEFQYINKQIEFNKKKKEYFNRANQSAPSKPTRTPTVKLNKKPDYLTNAAKQEDNCSKEAEQQDEPLNYDPSDINNLNIRAEYDLNAPNLNISSLIDIKSFECSIIKDRAKHLDRLALIESNKLLLLNSNSDNLVCCEDCMSLTKNISNLNNLAIQLAKCFTYNDLKYLRFNIDFGLGIYTGLELIMLPHGEQIRADIIER